MRGTVAGLIFLTAGATAAPLGAQVMLQPGAKVRITAPTAGIERFQGTVIAAGDTIDVAGGDARVRIPVSALTRLELSRGKERLAGAGRGALWGAGIGLALGALTNSHREAYTDCDYLEPLVECDPFSTVEWLAMNAGGGAAWGALIGAIVGRERWDVIAMPRATRTSMTVRAWVAPDGRMGVVATLR